MRNVWKEAVRAGVGLVLLLSGWGCSSLSGSISSGFASVKITDHSSEEIVAATIRVFEGEGYLNMQTADELIFEKEASEWDQAAYGSNINSEDDSVLNQVRVQVVDKGGGTYVLQCNAYIIQNEGGAHEHKIRLRRPRSGPYRDMLKKVANSFTVTTVD